MSITRRSVLQGVLIAAAAAGTGKTFAGTAIAGTPVSFVVYDGRLPQSRAWSNRYSSPAIDVAHEHAHFWRNLRGGLPAGPVVGLTRWSDFVLVRTLLQEKGLRLRTQARRGDLFQWEMI
jgi:hypothetical protein